MMPISSIVSSIARFDGVYGAFCSPHAQGQIIAEVPPSYHQDSLARIGFHAAETLRQMKNEMPTCHEVRADMGPYTFLMCDLNEGTLVVMINNRGTVPFLSSAIHALCKDNRRVEGKVQLANPEPEEIPTPADQDGQSDKRYTNEGLVGEGGTAHVYRAYDTRLRREIALKRFKENKKIEGDYVSELETASRIHHHNVVSTFDADEDEQGRFIVMELIKGQDLEAAINKDTLTLNRFTDFATQALEGLLATHQGGLLHLDLKPSNIMISTGGSGRDHVKLIDYGRAKFARDPKTGDRPKGGGMDGSIYYASPEFINSQELDERADLYALGCVFYWALSGKRPFDGDTTLQVMAAHLQHKVTNLHEVVPEIPRSLCDWVMSLLELEPSKRPRDASDALNRLGMDTSEATNTVDITTIQAKAN